MGKGGKRVAEVEVRRLTRPDGARQISVTEEHRQV